MSKRTVLLEVIRALSNLVLGLATFYGIATLGTMLTDIAPRVELEMGNVLILVYRAPLVLLLGYGAWRVYFLLRHRRDSQLHWYLPGLVLGFVLGAHRALQFQDFF